MLTRPDFPKQDLMGTKQKIAKETKARPERGGPSAEVNNQFQPWRRKEQAAEAMADPIPSEGNATLVNYRKRPARAARLRCPGRQRVKGQGQSNRSLGRDEESSGGVEPLTRYHPRQH
jgi:hypothetical protein